MADEMVRLAQRFINSYDVPGIPKLAEDGKTGWSVMYALTRALQHELGITALSDSFGPTTLALLQQNFPVIDGRSTHGNINRIVAYGLYCKGYPGGARQGVYDSEVAASVTRLKQDMGVAGAFPGDGLTPKVFKGLLNMDPYVVVNNGRAEVRAVQQWLNGGYVGRRDFFIVPCDGHFSRDVQKALLLAIQFEIGMSDDVANGRFGPGTKAGIRNNLLQVGSSGRWVQLFTAAMIFNQRAGVGFASVFTGDLATRVGEFQRFVALPATGDGDYQTWASLLVSCGDETRRGTASDTVTEVTLARAQALLAAGYQVVGRYLCNVSGSSLNKMIQPFELETIAAAGLRVFPIYQTYGGEAGYFRREQGMGDAFAAISWARHHGFKAGTRIYFAVDFDALDYQVTDNIIPHFQGIKTIMDEHGPEYPIGIYGPRNVCSRVRAAGLSTASFVSDMSTGFSGNLGYPMPVDWAFDQIATIGVGSGTGAIEIDNNIASGRDLGQNSFAPSVYFGLDVSFDMSMRDAMLRDVQTYLESINVPETGGPGGEALTLRSTTQAYDATLGADGLITSLARTLRVRKALIQCPLLWEIRKFNVLDPPADDAVRLGLKDDSSTGLGQIFAQTAIRARNHCIRAGVIGGQIMDFANDADRMAVWTKLHEDNIYNISTVPLVLIEGANDIGLPRPEVNLSEDDTRRVLARYNGTGDAAENYGRQLIGLYRVFEKYHKPLREAG
ncbi:glycoside hydrolase domain-containing protein [Actinophytocola sediminis]